MDRHYEIFESLPDGSVIWRGRACGLNDARWKLHELTRATGKEYFAIHLPTRDMVVAADASKVASERAAKRILQVTYDAEPRLERARLLRSLGYAVMSAMGNEAAKALLTTLPSDSLGIALFIVGHAAPAQTRREMVDWLKTNYPETKVLALNPPNERISKADYNAMQKMPEAWLPLVAATIKPPRASAA